MPAQFANPQIVTNGLIFDLDAADKTSYAGSGNTWYDVAGFNNGYAVNLPSYSTENGGYFNFTTISQSFDCGSGSAVNITNNITLDSWVYVNSYVLYGGIIVFGSRLGEQYSLNTYSGGRFFIGTNWPTNWQQGFSTILNTNTWYNITATFASGNWAIHVNGVQNSSGTFSVSSLSPYANSWLVIGDNQPGTSEWFNGRIANVKIYNRVLTSLEIQQNYNTLKSRFGLS